MAPRWPTSARRTSTLSTCTSPTATTGKVKRRILKSGVSSNYETYRFINSQANWSPDGKYLAFAAKQGGRDVIVIVDVERNKEVKRIEVKLSGVTTPAWSPDGQQLVFTGYDGGSQRSVRRQA